MSLPPGSPTRPLGATAGAATGGVPLISPGIPVIRGSGRNRPWRLDEVDGIGRARVRSGAFELSRQREIADQSHGEGTGWQGHVASGAAEAESAGIGIGTGAKSFLEAFQIPSNTQNSADFR